MKFGFSALRHLTRIVRVNARMLLDRLGGKRVLILDLEESIMVPFLEPVVQQLRKRTHRIAYYCAYKTSPPSIAGIDFPPGRSFYFRCSRFMAAADMFLAPHVWNRVPRWVQRVHVPHGHPVKFACLPKQYFAHFDIHFVTGPLHREQTEFSAHHYQLGDRVRIFDVGLPKSDKLLNGSYDRRAVLSGLGLDPARRTVLYAPSWEEGLSLRAFRERLFDLFAGLTDANVLIKLHPVSCVPPDHPNYEFYTGGTDWTEFIRPYLRFSHIRNVVTNDIDPLLAASDIMVSDISGVALEFLCMLKPVIYLDCPDFFTKTLPSVYKDFGPNTADYIKNDPKSNAGRHVGYLVANLADLPQAIAFVGDHPEYKLAERREYAARIRYNPGHAAEAAADTILGLLELK